ncbi:MAG TPA: signal peptidase I [Solirubrobacteraceae bacterium]|nr:signal peptidase I [Solirubrobacteraceae bacterium]
MSPGARTGEGQSSSSQPSGNGATSVAAGPAVALKGDGKKPKSVRASIVELLVIIGVALGLALGIQAVIVKPYRIPSGSMEPTLSIGQRVLVNRIGMDFSEPHVGEIAVFHPPEGAEQEECGPSPHVIRLGASACSAPVPKENTSVNFIKRVVAGPGDEIYIQEGRVFRKAAGTTKFVREKDSYIRRCGVSPECNFPTPIKVPAGHWFMMGDNRGESDDSRFWGPVPTGWIIGQAIATYWPPDRIGIF